MAEPMHQDHLYQQHEHQLQLQHHQNHQNQQLHHQNQQQQQQQNHQHQLHHQAQHQSGESHNVIDIARVHDPAAAEAMAAVDPEPHMSSQFYTFNRASHELMVSCLLAGRNPSSDEVRRVATPAVLASWRGVWKDRHEDTAYLTGWRRIQEKLQAQVDDLGSPLLFFKNSPYHYVPFIEQWAEIVQQAHIGPDLKHYPQKETLDRIREVWTVGAKFYGVPESYVKACIATCPVCNAPLVEPAATAAAAAAGTSICDNDVSNVGDQLQQQQQQQPRRRRFEYTESFEVAAKDVPQRLQHLACKYKVVLCIRQKYIRYKPFLAEVKDYCCHRGGEPTGRKPGVLKRKRYMSKRCGCSFRIRAIVPIVNYDEKEKTFSYQEDGVATFKLYAVHSGHEPGPHEGSARIIHRFVDPSSLLEEMEAATEKEEEETRQAVVRQLQELQMELSEMEQKLGSVPVNVLETLCQDLTETMQRIRAVDKGQTSHQEDWVQDDMNRDQETSAIVQQQQQQQQRSHQLSQLPRTTKLSSFCTRCGAKGRFEETCICRSCELVMRQASVAACHEEGSLDSSRDAAMVVSGYCADSDKWYEGMACGLDTAHSVEFLGHAIA